MAYLTANGALIERQTAGSPVAVGGDLLLVEIGFLYEECGVEIGN